MKADWNRLRTRFTLRLQKAATLLAVLISRWTRGYLSPSAFTMTIFDLPPINATLNGPSTLRICGGWISIYFMLYQWFPSTHFEELKKRYEVKIEAARH